MDPLREGVVMMCGATVGAFVGLLAGGILDQLVDPPFAGSNGDIEEMGTFIDQRIIECPRFPAPPPPNDQVQQRGRLERPHATKGRPAGPVCSHGWFGVVIPREPNPDPVVFLRLSVSFSCLMYPSAGA